MPCPPLHTRIRSSLRALWLRSPERYQAIKDSRVGRGQYQCAECGSVSAQKDVNVDHIDACGSLRGLDDVAEFTRRLFTGALQVLCVDCHGVKTKVERAKKV